MIHQMSLKELASGLVKKSYSSVELTQAYLKRIKQYNGTLNSFISITEECAIKQAKSADKLRQQQQSPSPLLGIPIAHKDIFCTQGIKTTCGSKMLADFIAPYSATVVSQLEHAGCVLLGKTNMDEFAMGSSNETSYFGPSTNPWDTAYVPGGSSGGSAAAVAARLVPATTGTDTGGSIRQPASLCGITGLKPTYGRVSRWGMIAFASSLDQGGPITQTAQDAALMLQGMAGFDHRDSTSLQQPVPDYQAGLNDKLDGLTIGLPTEYFDEGLDPDISQVLEEAMAQLKKLGVQFKNIHLPHAPLAIPVYYVISSAECSSNLSRYDGVRFGYRCEEPRDLLDLYCRSRGVGFGKEVKRRIMTGTFTLSAGYYDAYYGKAQQVRRRIADDFKQAFKEVDVILSPTSPCTAFKLGEKLNDPISMYLSDLYTGAANLAGLPGLSIPAGFINGLPIGLQLIGNYLQEGRLLQIGHQFQQHTDWHRQMPKNYL